MAGRSRPWLPARDRSERLALHPNMPLAGRERASGKSQQRGLARAVAPRQHQHLTLEELQVHAAEHGAICQGEGDGVEAEGGHRASALA